MCVCVRLFGRVSLIIESGLDDEKGLASNDFDSSSINWKKSGTNFNLWLQRLFYSPLVLKRAWDIIEFIKRALLQK